MAGESGLIMSRDVWDGKGAHMGTCSKGRAWLEAAGE